MKRSLFHVKPPGGGNIKWFSSCVSKLLVVAHFRRPIVLRDTDILGVVRLKLENGHTDLSQTWHA